MLLSASQDTLGDEYIVVIKSPNANITVLCAASYTFRSPGVLYSQYPVKGGGGGALIEMGLYSRGGCIFPLRITQNENARNMSARKIRKRRRSPHEEAVRMWDRIAHMQAESWKIMMSESQMHTISMKIVCRDERPPLK